MRCNNCGRDYDTMHKSFACPFCQGKYEGSPDIMPGLWPLLHPKPRKLRVIVEEPEESDYPEEALVSY